MPLLIQLFDTSKATMQRLTHSTVLTRPHTYDTEGLRKREEVGSNICSGIWESEARWKTWFGSLPPVFALKFWRHGSKSSWEVSQDLLGLQEGVPCKLRAWPTEDPRPRLPPLDRKSVCRALRGREHARPHLRCLPVSHRRVSSSACWDQSPHKLSELKRQQLSSRLPQQTLHRIFTF